MMQSDLYSECSGFSNFQYNIPVDSMSSQLPQNTPSHKPRTGIILAIICAFLGSVKGLMISELKSLGPVEIFGLRSLGSAIFILPVLIYKKYQVWYDWKTNINLLLRALVGNVAVAGYYFGFAYLSLGDASVLFYSTPVYTYVIGCIFLKEPCGCLEVVCVLLSLVGVGLVTSPTFIFKEESSAFYSPNSAESVYGITGALVGAVAQSIAFVLLRKLSDIPAMVVSFWWSIIGVISSLLVTGLLEGFKTWQCGLKGVYVVLISAVGFASEISMVIAIYLEEAGRVSIALTSEIVWAFILQMCVQQRVPALCSVLGASTILVAILCPTLSEIYRHIRVITPKMTSVFSAGQNISDFSSSEPLINQQAENSKFYGSVYVY